MRPTFEAAERVVPEDRWKALVGLRFIAPVMPPMQIPRRVADTEGNAVGRIAADPVRPGYVAARGESVPGHAEPSRDR